MGLVTEAGFLRILAALDSQGTPSMIAAEMTSILREQFMQLRESGQTDAQLQTSILTTYAPILAAICMCRMDINSFIRNKESIKAAIRSQAGAGVIR